MYIDPTGLREVGGATGPSTTTTADHNDGNDGATQARANIDETGDSGSESTEELTEKGPSTRESANPHGSNGSREEPVYEHTEYIEDTINGVKYVTETKTVTIGNVTQSQTHSKATLVSDGINAVLYDNYSPITTTISPKGDTSVGSDTPVAAARSSSRSPSEATQQEPSNNQPIETKSNPANISQSGGDSGSDGGSGRGNGGGLSGAIGSVVTSEVQHVFESIGKITRPAYNIIDDTIYLWSKPVYRWATHVATTITYGSCFYVGFQIGRDPNLTLGQKALKAGIEGVGVSIELTAGVIAGGFAIGTGPGAFFVGAGAAAITAYGVNSVKDNIYEWLGL